MTLTPGDVVLVPFPYRDRLAERARPAIVISTDDYHQNGDVIVVAVTSHIPRSNFDYRLNDWQSAGLKIPSTVRMLLATLATRRILHHAGQLTVTDFQEVQKCLALALSVE